MVAEGSRRESVASRRSLGVEIGDGATRVESPCSDSNRWIGVGATLPQAEPFDQVRKGYCPGDEAKATAVGLLGNMDGVHSALDRIRTIVLALPEVNERFSHGEPCFFVRDKRPLCYYHENHKGDGRISLWCPAPAGAQDELLRSDAVRFFRPQQSAGGVFADWVGVFLDRPAPGAADWREIEGIIQDAYRFVAPKHLVKLLDSR